jgi:hypothetical protein
MTISIDHLLIQMYELTLLRGVLQEYAQEANNPVTDWLALLDTKYTQNTSHDLAVEVLLVKVLLHLALSLLPALLACVRRFEAARLLDLAEVDYKLSLCRSRLLCISKDLRNLCSQRCVGPFIWYLDCIGRLSCRGCACCAGLPSR